MKKNEEIICDIHTQLWQGEAMWQCTKVKYNCNGIARKPTDMC